MANLTMSSARFIMAPGVHFYQRMRSHAKILLPVDFSARSRIAAQQALAHHFRSEVTLLHAINDDISGRSWGFYMLFSL